MTTPTLPRRESRRLGFTLVELAVTTAVALVLMAGAYGLYIMQSKSYLAVEEETRSLQSSRLALEQISRELRMASFGVIGTQTFTDARATRFTFLGDVDSDVSGALAVAANPGDTQIYIDLDDGQDTVDASDYVFINASGTVEMIPVAQSGDAYDTSPEPDVIFLDAPVSHAYPAGATIVKTVEATTYIYTAATQSLSKNGAPYVDGVADLAFRYFNEREDEMAPEALASLTQAERAGIRRVAIDLTTGTLRETSTPRTYRLAVDLRNMGNPGFGLDACAPNAPSSVTITESGTCGLFGVAWSPPVSNACDGTDVTDLGGYKVSFGLADGADFTPAFNVADDTATETIVEDIRLESGNTYRVRVAAYDRSFNESEFSSETTFVLTDATPPDVPENVDASAAAGSVTVSWDPPAEDALRGFRVYRGTTPDFVPGPVSLVADETTLEDGDLEYTDTAVVACTTYYYRVAAVDCADAGDASDLAYGDGGGALADSPLSGITSTTPVESPPTPPASVAPFGASGSDGAVRLSWTNPADADFERVILRYSTSGYPATTTSGYELATIEGQPGAAHTYDHANLTNGTTYYYSAFACDRCGSCAAGAQASAAPNALAPVVQITSPAEGAIVTNGQIVFEAKAYDPDELNLSSPPNLSLDNGKGIARIVLDVTPAPTSGTWPRTEFVKSYCGFGGDSTPCPAGNIADWCPGTYSLSAAATDNEGQSTPASYRQIHVQGGGVGRDESIAPSLSGTYKQNLAFDIRNDAASSASITGVTISWDRPNARMAAVSFDGDTIWSPAWNESPAASGETIALDDSDEPDLGSGETATILLSFEHFGAGVTGSALAGSTNLTVTSSAGFSAGDVVHIGEGGLAESATIAAVSGAALTLATPMSYTHTYGERVSLVSDDAQMSMAGALVTVQIAYQLGSGGQSCAGAAFDVIAASGPVFGTAYQDEPTINTPMSASVGAVTVEEYDPVPVHVTVVDGSGLGVTSVDAYYKIDATMQGTPPSTGYGAIAMSESSGTWSATLPYASNARVWVYFVATDGVGATARSPQAGAYVYDLTADTTAPMCPLGLSAAATGMKEVALSWMPASEPDVVGYNVYRNAECGEFGKKYTQVQDQSPGGSVDYTDDYNKLNTTKDCYGYFITAVDLAGNESASCGSYVASAGDCPCGSN
ncbi:prepilin-type N-terminal cleavage/methylation domain-containing protein [bacterium]|nr:prepilin-type N-terminal cleavage/methylation domain-containing protein [bacterium]